MSSTAESSTLPAARLAVVTLLTSDGYLPGALALSQSLQAHISTDVRRTLHTVALVTPSSVSAKSVKSLSRYFDRVVGVEQLGVGSAIVDEAKRREQNVLDSVADQRQRSKQGRDVRRQAAKNLALLGRPELGEGAGAALSKLHAWRLTGYERVLFLDADTLVLRSIDSLLSLPDSPLWAAPDVGWPDAFNSGVMLLKPAEATFDGLRKLAAERGSWDGADQGLLNDYFGAERGRGVQSDGASASGEGWDRLSFTYNATPNGGYTYAPAYARYGNTIHIAHFIGANKPWNTQRPAARPATGAPPNDYTALLHAWHDAYQSSLPASHASRAAAAEQRNGGVKVVHSERGVEIVEEHSAFAVPTYQAVWDASGLQSTSAAAAGSVDELKSMFSAATVGDAAAALAGAAVRGAYFSLPLEGRISLMAPQAPAWDDAEEEQREHAEAYVHQQQQDQAQQQQHNSNFDAPSASGTWSPPRVTWNPALGPPPTGSDASDYQMRLPPDAYYENAWDAANQPRGKAAFFTPASGDAASRRRAFEKLQREHYFDNLGSARPDPAAVKAVFPWELHNGGIASSSRIWPDEPPSVMPGSGEHDASLQRGAVPSPTLPGSYRFDAAEGITPDARASDAAARRGGLPRDLSYTNAWDEAGSIGKFGQAPPSWSRRASNEGKSRGVQAVPDLNVQAAQASPHYRNWGGPMDGSSVGAHDAAADQSGDGDDESSSGGDDDDEDEAQGDARAASKQRKSAPEGRGYQRKAELSASALAKASPRSPRQNNMPLPSTSSSGGGSAYSSMYAPSASSATTMGSGSYSSTLGPETAANYFPHHVRSRSNSGEDSASTLEAVPSSGGGGGKSGAQVTGRARIRPDATGATYDKGPWSPGEVRGGYSYTSAGSGSGMSSPPTLPGMAVPGASKRQGREGSEGSGTASPVMASSPVFSRSELAQMARTHAHAGSRRGGRGF